MSLVTAATTQPLVTAGHLIKAGVLPCLAPKRGEAVNDYLKRLSLLPSRYEGRMSLALEVYQARESEAEERSEAELVITSEDRTCDALSCSRVRRPLARLHPRLLGSMLAHLSISTCHSWSVYTARDAIEDAEIWRYEGSTKDFWRSIHEDLHGQLARRPTKAEVVEEAEERGVPPGVFLREIGLNEALPALSAKLRLSTAQMRALVDGQLGKATSLVQQVADHLDALYAEQLIIQEETSEDDLKALYTWGEMRHSPVLSLSGRCRTHGYVHAVIELLEETWQIAAQSEGFFPNVLIRVQGEADAQRASRLLGALQQSLEHVQELVRLLGDDDNE